MDRPGLPQGRPALGRRGDRGAAGLVRVFLEDGPCYECTLGATDRKILSARKSCSLLSANEMETGKVPTNSTTASVIAGVQVQEAVKLLVGRRDLLALRNQAWMYTGDTLDSYVTSYDEDEWCMSHDQYAEIIRHTTRIVSLADLVHHVGAPRIRRWRST